MQRLAVCRTATFIVRVWTEYLSRPQPTWRGEIENVQTGEIIRFRNLGEMDVVVQRCVLALLSSDDKETPE